MQAGPTGGRTGQDPRVLRRLLLSFVSANSYGMVLLLIIITYGMSVSLRGRWSAPIVLVVQIVTVWLALRTSNARRAVRLTADVLLIAAGAVAVLDLLLREGGRGPLPTIFFVSSALYVVAPFSIVRHLAMRRVIDLETMLGAIATYLLIGLSLAFVYRFLGALQSAPFFGSGGAGTMSQDVFFSFTTLTTTGYGNLVPAGQPGQSLAVMEMIIGQLFLVTALGKIVSVWRPGTWADRKTGGCCRNGSVAGGRGGCVGRRPMSDPGARAATASAVGTSTAPERGGLVLLALILVAAVANLNLAVANVALPSIGAAFDSSQTALDLIAVGYSLGLAASVLYLGALGDRHGRKLMLIVGTALAIPASLLAAYAPTDTVLFVARLLGGLAAGMAYPTTLALITALWSGPARTKSIALWSALGGAISALGPLLSGLLLEHFWWGSVFLLTLPAGRRGTGPGDPARTGPRERDDGPGRQPGRHPVRCC